MEKTHTILVADDSVTIQKVLELTFMDEPYEVISVGDGVRACEEIAKYKPSIVLADVHMPGQNGYEVCRQTKELWPNTPVLLLVGVFEPFDETKYRACGADGVIEKPFDSQDALRMVETLILGGHLVKPLLFSSRRIVHGPVTQEEVAHPGRDAGLKVFLCHASQDRPIVHELHRKLRISRFRPWMDVEDILPGQDWNLAIRRALRESDAVVVCLSKAALTKAGYVQREIAFALDLLAEQPEGSIFLIPLKLEECEIPERLKHLQFARFYDDKGFGRLVAALEERSRELQLRSRDH